MSEVYIFAYDRRHSTNIPLCHLAHDASTLHVKELHYLQYVFMYAHLCS